MPAVLSLSMSFVSGKVGNKTQGTGAREIPKFRGRPGCVSVPDHWRLALRSTGEAGAAMASTSLEQEAQGTAEAAAQGPGVPQQTYLLLESCLSGLFYQKFFSNIPTVPDVFKDISLGYRINSTRGGWVESIT